MLLDDKIAPFRNVFMASELLAYLSYRAPKLGYRCIELPTIRRYPKGEVPTKFRSFKGNLSVLAVLLRACLVITIHFRRHLVDLHYDELSEWLEESGIDKDFIFSSQGVMAPASYALPFAVRINSPLKNYDTGGMSVEGAVPANGHLGAILYGPSAVNQIRMEEGRTLFRFSANSIPAGQLSRSILPTCAIRPACRILPRTTGRCGISITTGRVSFHPWHGMAVEGILPGSRDLSPTQHCAIHLLKMPSEIHDQPCQPAAPIRIVDIWC